MSIKNSLALLSKEKTEKQRVIAVRKVALGIGVVTAVAAVGVATGMFFAPKAGKNTREDLGKKAVNTVVAIKGKFRKTAGTVKDAAVNAEQDINNVGKDVYDTTEGVKQDMKNGAHKLKKDIKGSAHELKKDIKGSGHKIKKDIKKASENISKEIKPNQTKKSDKNVE